MSASGEARARRGVLAACTIGNALGTTPAVHAVFGVFLVPLSQAFGWPRASISVVLGIMALTGAIVYPLAGRFADAHGARGMIILGNVLLALSICLLAFTSGSLVQFYLNFTLIGVFGAIAGTPIYSKVIADWFRTNRGTALGLSAGLGSGLGSVLMPVVAAVLVSGHGWRAGYLGIAVVVVAIGLPTLALLLRDVPRYAADSPEAIEAEAPGLTLAEAIRTPTFWLILVAIASGAGCTTAIFSHVVPILGDRGFGIATGTAVVGVFALVGSTWQIATGRLLDWASGPRIVLPMYLMAVAGLALLETGTGTPTLMIAGALLGIGLGSQFGALPFFVARYFGLRRFGAIIGVMYSAVIAAQGITPVLLDAAFDARGSYHIALTVAGGCLAVGALLLLLLPRYRRAPLAGDGVLAGGLA